MSVLEQALTVAEQIGYPVGKADALRGLGVVHGRLGKFDEGEKLLRDALALGRRLDEGEVQTGALNELGELLVDAARVDEASSYLDEAMARATTAGDRFERGRALLGLARVHEAGGASARADAERATALEEFAELDIPAAALPHCSAVAGHPMTYST